MFSKELELSISQAYQQAREKRHEYLTVEHMLLALLDNASALSILSACGTDVAGLEKDIRKVLDDTVPLLDDNDNRDTQPTIGFQRVLQRALYHVQSAGKDEVLGANPGEVEKYKGGKQQVFGFFVGEVMKRMKGKANPKVVNEMLRKKLDSQ